LLNYNWIVFPENSRGGVSYDWFEGKRPRYPLKQDIGDQWFYYQKRSRTIGKRTLIFHKLFNLALETKYEKLFYENEDFRIGKQKHKIVINGRDYIIGLNRNNEFSVIVYPENVVTEIL
jgi:hypothetical protein